jgi:hypothetical protein
MLIEGEVPNKERDTFRGEVMSGKIPEPEVSRLSEGPVVGRFEVDGDRDLNLLIRRLCRRSTELNTVGTSNSMKVFFEKAKLLSSILSPIRL